MGWLLFFLLVLQIDKRHQLERLLLFVGNLFLKFFFLLILPFSIIIFSLIYKTSQSILSKTIDHTYPLKNFQRLVDLLQR